MSYVMFIDDERLPTEAQLNDGRVWLMCATLDDVKRTVRKHGLPVFVSFDHDLGDNEPTGYDIAKWMVEQELRGLEEFPEGFEFYVHSQNPIGKENIEGYLNGYFRIRDQKCINKQ